MTFLGIILTKGWKYPWEKNYKISLEETEKDTNKWNDRVCSWNGRTNIVKIAIETYISHHNIEGER